MTPPAESFVTRAENLAERAKKVNTKPEAERAAEVLRIREEMQKLRAEIRAERAKGVLEDTKRKLDDLKAAPGIHAELVEEFEQTSSKAKDRLDQLAAPVDTDEMIADAKRGGDYRFVFSPEQMIQLAAAPADTQKLKDWGTAAGTDKAAVGRLADAITAALATAPEATKTTLKPLVDALRTVAPAVPAAAPGSLEAKVNGTAAAVIAAADAIGTDGGPLIIDQADLLAIAKDDRARDTLLGKLTKVEQCTKLLEAVEHAEGIADGPDKPKLTEMIAKIREVARSKSGKDTMEGIYTKDKLPWYSSFPSWLVTGVMKIKNGLRSVLETLKVVKKHSPTTEAPAELGMAAAAGSVMDSFKDTRTLGIRNSAETALKAFNPNIEVVSTQQDIKVLDKWEGELRAKAKTDLVNEAKAAGNPTPNITAEAINDYVQNRFTITDFAALKVSRMRAVIPPGNAKCYISLKGIDTGRIPSTEQLGYLKDRDKPGSGGGFFNSIKGYLPSFLGGGTTSPAPGR